MIIYPLRVTIMPTAYILQVRIHLYSSRFPLVFWRLWLHQTLVSWFLPCVVPHPVYFEKLRVSNQRYMVQFNQSSYFFFWKAIIWWWWYWRDRSIFFLFGRRVSLTSNFKPRTNILHLWRVWKRHFILITSHNATASQPSLGQCIFWG